MSKVSQLPEMDDEGKFKDLAMENEILKLKMQAEMGASFHSDKKIPPEIEALFLKQVIEFEEKYQQASRVSIHQFIGYPTITNYQELNDQQIKAKTEEILNLLKSKSIIVAYENIDPVTFYRFLSEELMFEETEDMIIDGMTKYYDYQEFHDENEQEDLN